jgi:hypothetical protein
MGNRCSCWGGAEKIQVLADAEEPASECGSAKGHVLLSQKHQIENPFDGDAEDLPGGAEQTHSLAVSEEEEEEASKILQLKKKKEKKRR